jgi:hypothetical protein
LLVRRLAWRGLLGGKTSPAAIYWQILRSSIFPSLGLEPQAASLRCGTRKRATCGYGDAGIAELPRRSNNSLVIRRFPPKENTMATERKSGKQRRGKQLPTPTDSAADEEALGEELLRVSREEQAEFVAGWESFMKQLGIRGKPIGAKKLREMLLQKGFDPESNEFSQGIIAMREE